MAKKPAEGERRVEPRPHRHPTTGEVVAWNHRVGSTKNTSAPPGSPDGGLKEGLMHLTDTSDRSDDVDPVVVDRELSETYARLAAAQTQLRSVQQHMHRMAGDRLSKVGRDSFWGMTFDEVLAKGTNVPYEKRIWEESLVKLDELDGEIDGLTQRCREIDRIWEENGRWSRFFLVTNAGGHIHSSMSCSTCYPTTEFAWLPEISGQTEAEAVENYGGILCSVCFPSAPSEWTEGESKADQQAREQRKQERAERRAAKLAKALMPDGEPLRLPDTRDKLATLRSAEIWLTDSYDDPYGRNDELQKNDRELVLNAVQSKTGKTREEVLAETKKRVLARRKREGRA